MSTLRLRVLRLPLLLAVAGILASAGECSGNRRNGTGRARSARRRQSGGRCSSLPVRMRFGDAFGDPHGHRGSRGGPRGIGWKRERQIVAILSIMPPV